MVVVGLIVPQAFIPVDTAFHVKMSLLMVMTIAVEPIFTLLAWAISMGSSKYACYCTIKGSDFPVPYYEEKTHMWKARDWEDENGKHAPIWKNNAAWEDTLTLDKIESRIAWWYSADGSRYLMRDSDFSSVLPFVNGKKIAGTFSFVKTGGYYSIVFVGR